MEAPIRVPKLATVFFDALERDNQVVLSLNGSRMQCSCQETEASSKASYPRSNRIASMPRPSIYHKDVRPSLLNYSRAADVSTVSARVKACGSYR